MTLQGLKHMQPLAVGAELVTPGMELPKVPGT
jgi:hypothetical protein